MTRVAIIGAGPCGLSQLHAFASDSSAEASDIELVCFEKQDDWGGLWNYTWRTGLDEHGEPCHGSMYRYLWSNGPKECLEFGDYGFEEHFGKPVASFPPREVLYDYIIGRVNRSGIRDKIRFNQSVRRVSRSSTGDGFTVTTYDHTADVTTSEDFDWVVVSTGHFSTPNMPHYPGYETFGGTLLHAHDFRDAVQFEGRVVLVIGSSYSAEDVASQLWKYGAQSVICSSRSGPMGFDWPEGITEKPILTHVDGRTVHFTDGTSSEVDAIVSCTGYLHHFPFIDDDLRLKTANRLASSMLYRGVVFQPENRMLYLGMQDQWYTFNMFDAQTWYARDVILGRIELPDADTQARWISEFQAAEDEVPDDYGAIDFQGDYTQDLLDQTDCPDPNTPLINKMFKDWKKHKKQSILGYRDHGHTSPVTGTMAPIHHTSWEDALDDSLESYLADSG
ncbi:NAD(P)-binding domain-containing protein [Candidatus Poriferisodalis sp.]|uniref:NAD(P)-binding domain-containing protein n=1 Tax=Candidatus Poriferisodalis sp. TaxID=3101277 RepID=UPI003B029399